jgi:hypothetical protein
MYSLAACGGNIEAELQFMKIKKHFNINYIPAF